MLIEFKILCFSSGYRIVKRTQVGTDSISLVLFRLCLRFHSPFCSQKWWPSIPFYFNRTSITGVPPPIISSLRSNFRITTSLYAGSRFSSASEAFCPALLFVFTPSTRASARAFTNSLFSKKDFVEMPKSVSSFFSSDTFMALHVSISAFIRSSRDVVVLLLLLEDSSFVLFFMGFLPSARAFSRAAIKSFFSRKLFVEIP
mmetsp:Transcript_1829/g.2770  ORF Transcript_1829/g.2770 Transcript_1829/m.2770 type:complete len:201 (+) Transcript_1829:228-830(+)